MPSKDELETALVHCYNDLAKVEGRTRRVAGESITMLNYALHAARRGRHHVTIDHMERVVDDLERLLEALKR